MDPADNMENHRVENVVLNDDTGGHKDGSPPDMLRFLQRLYLTPSFLFSLHLIGTNLKLNDHFDKVSS